MYFCRPKLTRNFKKSRWDSGFTYWRQNFACNLASGDTFVKAISNACPAFHRLRRKGTSPLYADISNTFLTHALGNSKRWGRNNKTWRGLKNTPDGVTFSSHFLWPTNLARVSCENKKRIAFPALKETINNHRQMQMVGWRVEGTARQHGELKPLSKKTTIAKAERDKITENVYQDSKQFSARFVPSSPHTWRRGKTNWRRKVIK